jgi:hypothetical protein
MRAAVTAAARLAIPPEAAKVRLWVRIREWRIALISGFWLRSRGAVTTGGPDGSGARFSGVCRINPNG